NLCSLTLVFHNLIATIVINPLSLHDALPIFEHAVQALRLAPVTLDRVGDPLGRVEPEVTVLAEHRAEPAHLPHEPLEHRLAPARSEEHTSELQSRENLVCRLLLEKKKNYRIA